MKTIIWKKPLMAALVALGLSASVKVSSAPPSPDFNVACDSTSLAGTPFVSGINCRVVNVDGHPREYIVYVPNSPSFNLSQQAPVVFFFHGSGGGAENAFLTSGWR